MNSAKIFSVAELNASIRGLLETQFPFVSVAGEISNLRQPLSGHLYFTLKDEQAQLKAVLFKIQQRYLSDSPADGKFVVCRGRISVYEPRGEYQLIVDTIDFHGVGTLQLEFEKLKKKLAAEGLFDQERKKGLPPFPEHITLITSPSGAAVHDFLRIARQRFPQVPISIYPVAVQGRQAGGEIVDALATINAHVRATVIVLCRGGGSLEDLWAFNEERVARAIATSGLPVVSAVGHEIDFTIADLVADLRAPTPSAAAQMLLPDRHVLRARIDQLCARLLRRMGSLLERLEDRTATSAHRLASMQHCLDRMLLQLDHRTTDLERAAKAVLAANRHLLERAEQRLHLTNPLTRLQMQEQRLTDLHRRFLAAGRSTMDSAQQALQRAAGLLEAVSPLATLARGYSIVRTPPPEANVVTDSQQVEVGGRLYIILHRGTLECLIEKAGRSQLFEKKEECGGE
ncbi:MAG TPA: exodeoxyribonuclease VII large subunit [Desulfobulbaceae bacterium]|nr:exodeoxyribonuclease VII large subunit [Desulfobulbaceae bacterium]